MRRNNLVVGSIILLVGILLLIHQFAPQFQLTRYIFPVVLILLGLWFLVGRRLLAPRLVEEPFSLPLNGAREADVLLRHAAGRLAVSALDGAGQLLSGTFVGGVAHELQRTGDHLRLSLNTPSDVFFGIPAMHTVGYSWSLGLSREVILNLELQSGANEGRIDLTDLNVRKLTVKTGASSTQISLPVSAGYTAVKVEAGAASVSIQVPQGVAGRINTRGSGMSSINVDRARFEPTGDGYQSPGYDAAANKADIIISTGVGSVDIS